jgi:hypothetical protein
MPLSEQMLAHRLQVLRHLEKAESKSENAGRAESSGQQMSLRLIGEVRRETGLRSASRKGGPITTARQPGLQGL